MQRNPIALETLMFVRSLIAAALIAGFAAAPTAQAADPLCKPGHVLDETRALCYDPATAYRPNVPAQQSLFGGSAAPAAPAPTNAPASAPAASSSDSGGGFFGWLSDQARFCNYGDKQVGKGDAAYCQTRDGKVYPAGK
jgi:hypothetical protein